MHDLQALLNAFIAERVRDGSQQLTKTQLTTALHDAESCLLRKLEVLQPPPDASCHRVWAAAAANLSYAGNFSGGNMEETANACWLTGATPRQDLGALPRASPRFGAT